MHKTVTSATQPSNAVQHPLVMPPLLQHLGMHAPRDQMVVRQRDPVTLADFACVRPRARPHGRRLRRPLDVLVQHFSEEIGHIVREAVDGEGFGDGCGERRCEVVAGGGGEGSLICGAQGGVVLEGGVREGF